MPSKLPVIKGNTTQVNIDKMKIIAEKNKRTLAKELEFIVEMHIREYEEMYGEIIIDEKRPKSMDEILSDPLTDVRSNLKDAVRNGFGSTSRKQP